MKSGVSNRASPRVVERGLILLLLQIYWSS